MQEIRYLDELIDELAKGKAMEKILRKVAARSQLRSLHGRTGSRIDLGSIDAVGYAFE